MHAGEQLKVIHLGYPAETPSDSASRIMKPAPAPISASPSPPHVSTSFRPRAPLPTESRSDAGAAKTESSSGGIKKSSKLRLPPWRHDTKTRMTPEETRPVEEAPEKIERKGAAVGKGAADRKNAAEGRSATDRENAADRINATEGRCAAEERRAAEESSAADGKDTPPLHFRMKASEAERIDGGEDRETPAETLLSLSIQVALLPQILTLRERELLIF